MVIVAAIKDKKELRSLDDNFVQERVDKYFLQFPKKKKDLEANNYNPKSAVYKQVVKDVRSQLREIYGVFQIATPAKRTKWLEELAVARGRGARREILDKLLKSHQSTAERAEYYSGLYKELFADIEFPTSILDIGCGFNPISYDWLEYETEYLATDISTADIEFISQFFTQEEIKGKAFVCDLLKLPRLPKAEVVLMFKLVDTLESQRRNISKEIILGLDCKLLIVSFPTVSIGGKKMREGGKENWFSRFIDEQGWKWRTHTIPGEEFWIVTKI